jgi:tRNA wybutosine-synthesizing protein 1
MHDLCSYIDLLKEAEPTYIEAKAYMYVGYSRSRLSFEAMPTYQDIQEFSETLAEELNYNIVGSSRDSRVLLLSRLKTPQRLV